MWYMSTSGMACDHPCREHCAPVPPTVHGNLEVHGSQQPLLRMTGRAQRLSSSRRIKQIQLDCHYYPSNLNAALIGLAIWRCKWEGGHPALSHRRKLNLERRPLVLIEAMQQIKVP